MDYKGYKKSKKIKDAVGFFGYANDDRGTAGYTGLADRFVRFSETHQLNDKKTWAKFVEVFRHDSDDHDRGWRCEFWGKMMRGGCLTYSYSGSEELYSALDFAAREMLTAQRPDGRFSTYSEAVQFGGWDLWGRKYVMTGFMHFYRICRDEQLKEKIVEALTAHADHIVAHVGLKKGQIHIGVASDHWLGMNSCTILEPFMELYRLTGKRSYFEFAKYIISTGGTYAAELLDVALSGSISSFKREQFDQYVRFMNLNIERCGTARDNLIEIAIEGKFKPYEYPVAKAYEMTSFFEGVLAYYEMTGEEKYLEAVTKFMNSVMETDMTVIGCSGCTHELFDHSGAKQATYSDIIMQETCVTVTWMRMAIRLYALTGDPGLLDSVERSAYNALYGSANTERLPQMRNVGDGTVEFVDPMPFDSYSPLRANKRNKGVGGFKKFEFGGYYGCCACIASAGTALLPRIATVRTAKGIAVNSFMTGEVTTDVGGKTVTLRSVTNYPSGGSYTLTVSVLQPTKFTLDLRIPDWAEGAVIKVAGKKYKANPGKYTSVTRFFCDGDTVEVEIPMTLRQELCDGRVALLHGPLVLARDEAKCPGEVDAPLSLDTVPEYLEPQGDESIRVKLGDVILTDYATAGKKWNLEKCRVNVWFDRAN